MNKVFIISGISGSGKSTWVKNNIKKPFTYINADSIRKELYGDENTQGKGSDVFRLVFDRYQRAIDNEDRTIVVDNTSPTPEDRIKYITPALKQGSYEINIVYFKIPLKVAQERNLLRPRQVPNEVIEKQFIKLTPPTSEERKICKVIEVTD